MRKTFMAASGEAQIQEAYAEHVQPKRGGFDGWLMAVRAMVFLFAGMLVVSFATVI